MSNSKQCSWCKQSLPLEFFTFENKTKNLRKNYCKICNAARMKSYYYKNQKELLDQKKSYYQKNRLELLQKAFENRNNPESKQKKKDFMDSYLKKNPNAFKKAAKKRKAILRGAEAKYISKKEFDLLQSSACFYCGVKDKIQIDHVVPISRGGHHTIGNIVPACQRCNLSKNKWFITEWKRMLRRRAETFLKI